ncbi:LysR substrate-binding domain-containing protein [Roseovarius aestuarii]|nr:LysR substrate-binding domain-containing protein [Roseovarius aestuarii]
MNTKDLDLNLLILFDAIYSTGSISRAAVMLDMNQPTVSNALTRLRKQLDDPLFVREGKGVRPTERADVIIAPVRQALLSVRSIQETGGPFDPAYNERLFRLHVFDVFEPLIMPGLAAHAVDNPKLAFKLLYPQAITGETAVIDGLADLAIGMIPDREPNLEWEELCPMDLVVVARKGHPTLKDTITGPEIASHGHVILDLNMPAAAQGARSNTKKLVLTKKNPLRQAIQVPRPSSIVTIVASSDLIGFLPRFYVESLPDQGGLQILTPPHELSNLRFYMIWNQRRDNDPSIIWLRQHVKDAVHRAIAR